MKYWTWSYKFAVRKGVRQLGRSVIWFIISRVLLNELKLLNSAENLGNITSCNPTLTNDITGRVFLLNDFKIC